MKELNTIGQQFAQTLQTITANKEALQEKYAAASKVHVVGAGGTLSSAYEQLRNAAENAEEHLLLQHAIRRFFKRNFMLRDEKLIQRSGEELIIELTLAEYLENDSVPEEVVTRINNLAQQYYAAYQSLSEQSKLSHKDVDAWTYEVLAVEVEWQLNDSSQLQAFTQAAHQYFYKGITDANIFTKKPADFELGLYVAIHRALLKSDLAAIRIGLLRRYKQDVSNLDSYVQINQQIDILLDSPTVDKLYRYIDRHGAPLRVLRHMVEDDPSLSKVLLSQNQFLTVYESQVASDYASINRRVNHGIIRSVIFLIITKFIIGLAIEIPYDYLILGTILWMPLLINLAFPPLYMLVLRGTLVLPRQANTTRLVERIDRMLYGDLDTKQLARRPQNFSAGFNVVYALAFVLVFGGAGYILWHFFHFELLHLVIFFVFLSGASFLGFRLSRMIRELESVDTTQNAVTTVRDFLYMPFVVVGRYMSEKYAQVNIVALAMDMLIELPLKTILRLVRQWTAFISAKQDQL